MSSLLEHVSALLLLLLLYTRLKAVYLVAAKMLQKTEIQETNLPWIFKNGEPIH